MKLIKLTNETVPKLQLFKLPPLKIAYFVGLKSAAIGRKIAKGGFKTTGFGTGAVIIAALFFMAGCTSLFFKPKDFSPHAPLGLVTVISNDDINWLGEQTIESGGAFVGDFVRKALGLKSAEKVRTSRVGNLINEAETTLRTVLEEGKVFHLEDKDRLIGAAAYRDGNQPDAKSDNTLVADGYRKISYRDKGFASRLAAETGIKSLLYITFEFNKEFVSGMAKTGKARARVLMSVMLISPEGKIIYRKDIETHSRDLMAVSDGAYAEDELIELFKEPIGEACYRFIWDFAGTSSPL